MPVHDGWLYGRGRDTPRADTPDAPGWIYTRGRPEPATDLTPPPDEADEQRALREQVRQELVRAGRDSRPDIITRVVGQLNAGEDVRMSELPLAVETPAWQRPMTQGLDVLAGAPLSVYGAGGALFDILGQENVANRLLDAAQEIREKTSVEGQRALQRAEDAEGFWATAYETFANPSVALRRATEAVPYFMGGAGVARGLGRAAPGMSPLARAAGGEAALSGTLTTGQLRGAGEDWPTALGGGAAAGAYSGLVGYGMGRGMERLGITDPESMLAGRTQLGRFQPFGVPGEMFEEGVQEMGEGEIAAVARGEAPSAARAYDAFNQGFWNAFLPAATLSARRGPRRVEPEIPGPRLVPAPEVERVAAARGAPSDESIIANIDSRRTKFVADETVSPRRRTYMVRRGDAAMAAVNDRRNRPVLDQALTAIGQRADTEQANRDLSSEAAVREVVWDRTIRRLERNGDAEGARAAREMTDRQRQRQWAQATVQNAPIDAEGRPNVEILKDREPWYQERALYDAVKTKPERKRLQSEIREEAQFREDHPGYGLIADVPVTGMAQERVIQEETEAIETADEEGGEVRLPMAEGIARVHEQRMKDEPPERAGGGSYIDDELTRLNPSIIQDDVLDPRTAQVRVSDDPFTTVQNRLAAQDFANHRLIHESSLTDDPAQPVGAAEVRAMSMLASRMSDREIGRLAGKSEGEIFDALKEQVAKRPGLRKEAQEELRAISALPRPDVEAQDMHWFERKWRGFVTQAANKGYYARQLEEGGERLTADLDRIPDIEVQARRLFEGPLRAAFNSEDITSEVFNQYLTPDGTWADDVPDGMKQDIEAGLRQALTDAVEDGWLPADTPSDTLADVIRSVRDAAGGSAPNTVGIMSAAINVADRAWWNRGTSRLAQGLLRTRGAVEVQEPNDYDTITFRMNGRDVHIQTDPWIASITRETSAPILPDLLQAIAEPIGFVLRSGMLTLNPGWQVGNPMTDLHRTAVNDPELGPLRALFEQFGDLFRFRGEGGWGEAAQAARSPLGRLDERLSERPVRRAAQRVARGIAARLPGAQGRAERAREHQEALRQTEEMGWMRPGSQTQFIRDPRAAGRQLPDLAAMIDGGQKRVDEMGAAARMARIAISPLTAAFDFGTAVMNVTEAKIKRGPIARRRRRRPGWWPTRTEAAEAQEIYGAPPSARTQLPGKSAPLALMQFFSPIINSMIYDGRQLVKPTTAAGAWARLAATTIAPQMFQLMVRANAFGTEDDEGWLGNYTRGMQALPAWRIGAATYFPTGAVGKDKAGRDKSLLFPLKFNRTFAPFFQTLAAGIDQARAGVEPHRIAREVGAAAVTSLLPGPAVWLDTIGDFWEHYLGEGRVMGGFGNQRPVFEGDPKLMPYGDRELTFWLSHLPAQAGMEQLGHGILYAVGKEDLSRLEEEIREQGGYLEQVARKDVTGISSSLVYFGEAGTEQVDRMRAAAAERAAQAPGREADREIAGRIAAYRRDAPAYDTNRILADSSSWAMERAGGDPEMFEELQRDYAQQMWLAHDEGRRWETLLNAASTEAGTAIIEGRGAGFVPSIRDWLNDALTMRVISPQRYQDWYDATMRAERQGADREPEAPRR